MATTREQYLEYANKIVSVLKDEDFFSTYKKKIESGASNIKMNKKRLVQDISIDWIDTIEEILPNLDHIVRNPRKFIVQQEDIVDVSLARSISTESVKHLAQHTNMISKVDKDGSVTPSKILNITKEESFEIYENRFIYTLLLKIKDFVTLRYDKIKKATATQDVLQMEVESRYNLPEKKISYRTEYLAQLSFDEVMQLDPETLTKVERIAKIDRIVTDFLSSSFAKAMRHCAPVRPPISRTNVILKEPNFKKALVLWQFIETYQVTGGFSTTDEVEELPIDNDTNERLRNMVALNSMIFESMYDQSTSDDVKKADKDSEFIDIMRVGELDFLPDKIVRDPWAQKFQDSMAVEEKEKEVEKSDEKAESFDFDSDKGDDDKTKAPELKKQDQVDADETSQKTDEKVQGQSENITDVKDTSKEGDDSQKSTDNSTDSHGSGKEIHEDMLPKYDENEKEVDDSQFDKFVFDIRKVYKRPDEDKLKQQEMMKIKDAIDRCLNAYKKIKKDNQLRETETKRQRDNAMRAEALRKHRSTELLSESLGVALGNSFVDDVAKIKLPQISDDEIEELDVRPKEANIEEIKKKLSIGNMNLENKPNIEKFDFGQSVANKTESVENKADDDQDEKNKLNEKQLEEKQQKEAERLEKEKQKEIERIEREKIKEAERLEKEKQKEIERLEKEKIKEAERIEREKRKEEEREILKQQREDEKLFSKAKKLVEDAFVLDEAKKLVGDIDARIVKVDENKNSWTISKTTANQKYSKATGKKIKISDVDSSKLSVGKISISTNSINDAMKIDFGTKVVFDSNRKRNEKSKKKNLVVEVVENEKNVENDNEKSLNNKDEMIEIEKTTRNDEQNKE